MIGNDNLDKDMLRSVLDAIPAMVFVVDNDVRIVNFNAAAGEFLTVNRPAIIKKRGGDVLHCIHASDVLMGCGRGPFCGDCVIRNSVTEAFHGSRVVRRRMTLEVFQDDNEKEIYALITTSPFFYKEKRLALLVIEDIRDLEFAELPYIMSPYTQIGGVYYEDFDLESKWSIPTNCRLGFTFG